MAVIVTIMAFDLKTSVTTSFHGSASRLPSLLVPRFTNRNLACAPVH
jgi:hypothetical protein